MRTLALAALAATFVTTAALPRAAHAQDEIGIAVGARAPDATVQTLDGKPAKLSEYIGKTPVVLEFWATWCSNCKELEPQFLSLAKRYGSQVTFVDVAVSVNQSPERVKRYAEKYHYTHHMVYDTDGNAVTAYNVPATSYVVVIDKTGKVVYTGLGGDQNLSAAIGRVL